MKAPLIVGFGGTTRPGSSGERLATAVLAKTAELGAKTLFFCGCDLAALPHFAPENSTRTPKQIEFLDAVRLADGIVIATPGYHGGVSGLVKNAIDLLEDLREAPRPYFDGRAVGLIVSAAGWQAGGVTLASMRGIVHAMRGWPTPLGIMVNTVAQKLFDEDGRLIDEGTARMLEMQAQQIMFFAERHTTSEKTV